MLIVHLKKMFSKYQDYIYIYFYLLKMKSRKFSAFLLFKKEKKKIIKKRKSVIKHTTKRCAGRCSVICIGKHDIAFQKIFLKNNNYIIKYSYKIKI